MRPHAGRPIRRTERQRWLPRLRSADPGRDLADASTVGARLVVPGDDEWPADRLAPLDVPPLGLWVRGALDLRVATGRIGCRGRFPGVHCLRGARRRGPRGGLAGSGWTVVSGGAYGIDGAAHRAALAVGGLTVAVLASGVDGAYPQGHAALLARHRRAEGLRGDRGAARRAPDRAGGSSSATG